MRERSFLGYEQGSLLGYELGSFRRRFDGDLIMTR